MSALHDVAASLVSPGKGILAADESIATMSKRLEGAGVAVSPESRRDYRRLLLTTPELSSWVAGVILSDETLGQELSDGTTFAEGTHALGVLPGIKVDAGVTPLPFADGAVITEGLDGLGRRLASYRSSGAVFAKWRAVIAPRGVTPRAITANAHALARYAALCQEAGIVPIVEPEVLMDGDHDIALCQQVTANTLTAVFDQLDQMGVDPRGMILKPNMVVSGAASPSQAGSQEVAERTVQVLSASVPTAVPGIAFLSGGQSNAQASENLAAINREAAGNPNAPWRLTFSFGRALVADALQAWHGDPANVTAAQEALAHNCARASAATSASSPHGAPVGS